MQPCYRIACLLLMAGVITLHLGTYSAMGAAPDLTNGGIPTSTKNINLGPTGMQGWVYHDVYGSPESRQILVTAVAAGSPAAGVLASNDVILGANGTGADPLAFSADARKQFADAINDAEASNPATLKLLRWRAGATITVSISLETLGAYSATAPFNCPKSAAILEQGLEYFMANQTSGTNSLGALALLAANDPINPDNPARQERARNEIRALRANATIINFWKSGQIDTTVKITWDLGHRLIILSEYYLLTGDVDVLPTIEAIAIQISNGQSMFGTVGHQLARPSATGAINGPYGVGYGPVNSAGVPCFLGLTLAKKCGINTPVVDAGIARMGLFFGHFADWGSINYGEHEPGQTDHAANGKSGAAAIAFSLMEGRAGERNFFARMATAATSERDVGHTGAYFNYLWSPLGANLAGEEAAAAHFSRIRWMLDLNRRWDHGFEYNCYDGTNGGFTWNSAFHASTFALITYAMPWRQLCITGKGQNPAAWLSTAEVAETTFADTYDATTRTTNQLMQDLGNWSPKVRSMAAARIGILTAQHAGLLPTLEAMALDTNGGNSRIGACHALREIAADSSAATLASLLTDADHRIRFNAAEALRYLSNTAKLSHVNTMLSAVVTNDKPLLPLNADDPLQFAQAKLAMLLFYADSAYGPNGILRATGITGVNRNLLYPAVAVIAKHPVGQTRSTLRTCYELFTAADLQAMAGTIVKDSLLTTAPADVMFAGADSTSAISLLARNDIAEGVPLSIRLESLTRGVKSEELCRNAAISALGQYGASHTQLKPDPKVLDFLYNLLIENKSLVETEAALAKIEADINPQALDWFKRINWVVSDAETLTLPMNRTLLHADATDMVGGTSIYTWRKVRGAGSVTFTPNGTATSKDTTIQFDGSPGQYLFEVTMSDNLGLTEVSKTVAMTLYQSDGSLPANNPPTANAQSLSSPPLVRLPITLSGNDPEGLPLLYELVTEPQHGSLSGTSPGLTYLADATYSGADSFIFKVSDSEGQTATATISINVDPTALIMRVHEPFDYLAGPLAGKAGGTGMSGAWADGPETGTVSVYHGTTNLDIGGQGVLSWNGVIDNLTTLPTAAPRYIGATAGLAGTSWEASRSLAQTAAAMAGSNGVLWLSMGYHRAGSGWGQHAGVALATDCFTDRGKKLSTSGNYGSNAGNGIGVFESAVNSQAYSVGVFGNGTPKATKTSGVLTTGDFVLMLKFEFGATDKVTAYAFPESSVLSEDTFYRLGISTSSTIDESTLNRLTFSSVRGEPAFDDIRIGTTFASVLGLDAVVTDTTIPSPDPMGFSTPPTAVGSDSVTMTATAATDTSGVEYFFTCTSGNAPDSGWQNSRIYLVNGLQSATSYTFTVKARDKSVNRNTTATSAPASATTDAWFVDTSYNINFNFVGITATNLYGVYGSTGETWNQTQNAPATANNLVDSTGSVNSSISVNINGNDDRNADYALNIFDGNINLFNKGADQTITISGLTAGGRYDIYVYSATSANVFAGSTSTERAAGDFVTTNTVLGNGQSQALNNALAGTTSSAFKQGGNYVVFKSIVANPSGVISIVADAFDGNDGLPGGTGDTDTRLHVNGLQILKLDALVPDTTPPTLDAADIVDDRAGSALTNFSTVSYTVSFSEEMNAATVSAADFTNLGTAPVTIGTVLENAPGSFTVRVTPNGVGTLRLALKAGAQVTDLSGNLLDSTSAVIDNTTLEVSIVNAPPVWSANPLTGTLAAAGVPYASTLAGTASDADGDLLDYTKVSGPAWLSVAANGSLSGTPTNTDLGSNSFMVSVSDGIFGPVQTELRISVIEAITVPNLSGLAQAAAETNLTAASLTAGAVSTQYDDVIGVGHVISHTPVAGSLVLPGATVNLVVSLGPEPDTTPPVLVAVAPSDNSTQVAVGVNLTMTFDDPVSFATGTISLYKSTGQLVESFDVASPGPNLVLVGVTLTIHPTVSLAYQTDYYVQIDNTALQDLAGNLFAGITNNTTWNFTTGAADEILFRDEFTAAGGTSLTNPSSRATGTLASTLTYAWSSNSTTDVVVNGRLDWDSNADRTNQHQQATSNGLQNLSITNNLYASVGGKVWEVSFNQRVGWNHPLTFCLSDNPTHNGLWDAWDNADYDFASGSFGTSLRYDTDNEGGTSGPSLAALFPNPPNLIDTHHIRIRFDEPAGKILLWLNGVKQLDLATLDFATNNRYLSWAEPGSFAGALDNLEIKVIHIANAAPAWNSSPVSTANGVEGSSYSASLAGLASDPNDDSLVFAKISGPAWLSVAANGTLSGTPTSLDVGNNSFSVSVTDDLSTAVAVTLQVMVRSRFQEWAAGATSFNGDTNSDGIADGIAWLLGAADSGASGNGILPTPQRSNEGGLTLSFRCLNAANRGAATMRLQFSRDLGLSDPWGNHVVVIPETSATDEATGVIFVITPDGNLNHVQATIPPTAPGGSGKIFGRLMATESL